MSDNVVSITDKIAHIAGPCKCMNCGHEWTGVFPVGFCPLKCSECGSIKGIHQKFIARGKWEYTCNRCQCTVFSFCENGPYCIGCGEYHSPEDIGNIWEDER